MFNYFQLFSIGWADPNSVSTMPSWKPTSIPTDGQMPAFQLISSKSDMQRLDLILINTHSVFPSLAFSVYAGKSRGQSLHAPSKLQESGQDGCHRGKPDMRIQQAWLPHQHSHLYIETRYESIKNPFTHYIFASSPSETIPMRVSNLNSNWHKNAFPVPLMKVAHAHQRSTNMYTRES